METKLTEKQRRFALEYIANGHNAKQAAISAGYSPKTAKEQGCRLLTHVHLAAFLADKLAAVAAAAVVVEERLELSAQRVLEETMRIAYSDLTQAFNDDWTLKPMKDWSPELRAAIAGVEVDEHAVLGEGEQKTVIRTRKIKAWNKLQALEMLGKHLQLWQDAIDLKLSKMTLKEKADPLLRSFGGKR